MKENLDKRVATCINELETVINSDKLPNIYFVGKCGSGKSYSAKFMIEKYNYNVAKFAYPVYMLAEKYFGMTAKDRLLLQTIGTEAGRDVIGSDLWINRFKEDMSIVKRTSEIMNIPQSKFVMDDCRFPNEHQLLKEIGFIGIYLNVPDNLRKDRLVGRDGATQEHTFNHRSETLIDTFKDELIQLDYSGSIEESYAKLNRLLNTIIKD